MSAARDTRVVVVGQIARDIVVRVGELPGAGSSGKVSERLEMLGGKGANQAVGLAQLGMSVSLVGAVGGDETAGRLLDQAAADGIDVSWTARRAGPTALIVSLVEPGGWRYLEHIPPAMLTAPADIQAAAPVFRTAGTVVIQLQQPAQTVRAAAELAGRSGCRVVLEGALPESEDRQRVLAVSDVVRADDHEAELLTGRPIRSGADAIAAGREILRQGPTLAALAAGSAGNAVVWPAGSVLIPLAGGPVTDTTGGGDAFVAALVAALAHGLGPAQSGRKAAAAAAQTVRHLGGRPQLRRGRGLGADPFPSVRLRYRPARHRLDGDNRGEDAAVVRFRDRADAGRRLAARLAGLGLRAPVVLALPRGGVPVAAEVAAALGVSFDVFAARKVNAPGHQELGIGAVAEGLAEPVISGHAGRLGIGPDGLSELAERERTELARRAQLYRAGRPLAAVSNRDVVLVDDGLATGVTAEAALRALHARQPRRLVLAVPVCAREPARRLATVADDVVCVQAPAVFRAVGEWYENFSQMSDEQVLNLLGRRQPR